MLAPATRPSARARRLFAATAVVGATCVVAAASTAFGASSSSSSSSSKAVVVSDSAGDVDGPLDIRRVSLRRAADGRLRAVLSFQAKVTPRALLASSGPPGSACLRIWTVADADPKATRPDRLVCVTARDEDELRGGVYEVTGADVPKRRADASVKRNASGRSLVIRFTQSSLARPARIRFSVESTRPGCPRPNCIDTAPDKGAVRSFRLR